MLLLLFLSFSLELITVRTLPAPIVLLSVMCDLSITITYGYVSVHIMSYQWYLIQLTTPHSSNFPFHLTSRTSYSQPIVPFQFCLSHH